MIRSFEGLSPQVDERQWSQVGGRLRYAHAREDSGKYADAPDGRNTPSTEMPTRAS